MHGSFEGPDGVALPHADASAPISRIARGSFFNFDDGFNRASRRYEMQVVESDSTGFRVARNP